MSKSILILDTPETCLDCRFCRELHEGIEAYCSIMADQMDEDLCREIEDHCQEKPDWCPLLEVPNKKSRGAASLDYDGGYSHGYTHGFNSCIDEILKECDYLNE